MQKALIFGANGYLGRHLAIALKANNIAFTPTGSAAKSVDNYNNYVQADICNQKSLVQLDFNVDYIFVFAAITGTSTQLSDYINMKTVNELGLLHILQQHQQSNSKAKIILPSTRLVYKGKSNVFLKETDTLKALTPYAQTKINGEQLLAYYQEHAKINYTIFRICVPYGNAFDGAYSYGTTGFFLSKAQNGENISIYGDGSQKRTFTHVEDVVNVILATIPHSKSNNQVYNIGGNDHLSVKEVAEMIAKKFNVKLDFVPFPDQAIKIESGDTIFDDAKLQANTPFTYQHKINDWIEKI
ncbi:MAG: NAD(P)-dependent oxidoreductase [Vicingaceae bacterium]|nr:NAD(P)-dependent oxidoreductase [Vicingaceae bacterium]